MRYCACDEPLWNTGKSRRLVGDVSREVSVGLSVDGETPALPVFDYRIDPIAARTFRQKN